jgi:enoyl-CoA hydratase
MSELITVQREEHIAFVSVSQTMPPAFFDKLGEVFRELARDNTLRAVVVEGAGKGFSYGLDLAATFQEVGELFSAAGATQRTELLALIRRWQAALNAVAECPVPVIAAIHGWCIGGGLDLISACDIRLCTQDARFSLRETKVAIVADLGSLQRLPAIIGAGNLRELAFTGKDIDASRAQQMGLVNTLHPTRDELRQVARQMARDIAQNPPLTVRGVKDVLHYGEGKSIAEGLAYVAAWNSAFLASEDLAEAASAFAERRAPSFKGR